MVHFILLPETAQDRYRVFDRGLFNDNLLKAALKGCILLDALAVLVQCRCTDAAQLATCQHRLQQVRGIHASVAAFASHHEVHFVDKQNAWCAIIGHLFNVT